MGLKVNITSDGGHTRDEIMEARGYAPKLKIPICEVQRTPTQIASEAIIAVEREEIERIAREGRL